MRMEVIRNPYSSRIISLRPFPVTTPVLTAISSAIARATAIGIIVQRRERRRRIGVKATSVVIYVDGDEIWSKDGQNEQDSSCPISNPWHEWHLHLELGTSAEYV